MKSSTIQIKKPNNRLDQAEERILKLEDRSFQMTVFQTFEMQLNNQISA
jgi:hypothetical protein